MVTANKPLLDRFFDRGIFNDFGVPTNFASNVPREKVQTFVLSPEVALSAEMLVRSKSFKIPSISDFHMPYEHTAIEYPLTEDIRKLRETSTDNGSVEVTRIGAYIQEINEGVFTCLPYWEFVDGRIQHSFFLFIFGADLPGGDKVLIGVSDKEQDAIASQIIPCMSFMGAAQKLGIPPKALQEALAAPETKRHIREAALEIPCLMFASYLLINCKSGVGKTKVPARMPTKGMKLGGKKQKEYTASAYTLLHLEEIESVTAGGSISHRVDISAHYVRGHFKQRKSGIYWWNSFVRGNGEPRKREAYTVEI